MDVTLRRARPREVPVSRPSAAQEYIPRVLLRDEDAAASGNDGKRKPRWMPSEKKPGASKHLHSGHANATARNRLAPAETVSELDVERLETVEDELWHLESELDSFVHDFYVTAAAFSAQASAQRLLMKTIQQRRNDSKTP